MIRRNKTVTRYLLPALMLVVASVQADASYYCSMMDTVILDNCCCTDADFDEMTFTDSERCCEKSVDLLIDSATDQAQPTTKPIKFESDVDPPDGFVFIASLSLASLDISTVSSAEFVQSLPTTGSATYLITQRLRI